MKIKELIVLYRIPIVKTKFSSIVRFWGLWESLMHLLQQFHWRLLSRLHLHAYKPYVSWNNHIFAPDSYAWSYCRFKKIWAEPKLFEHGSKCKIILRNGIFWSSPKKLDQYQSKIILDLQKDQTKADVHTSKLHLFSR